jgi:katanin p60 ATPase-containing subunit A1
MQGEHEASRRMKTELLIQMDTLQPQDRVFVLAATNLPWELDLAILRRLEKRILVGLPTCAARKRMLQRALESRTSPDVDLEAAAASMASYSGSDVVQVAREAAMRPLRRLLCALEASDGKAVETAGMDPVRDEDLRAAITAVRCTSLGNQEKFEQFARAFGSNTSS